MASAYKNGRIKREGFIPKLMHQKKKFRYCFIKEKDFMFWSDPHFQLIERNIQWVFSLYLESCVKKKRKLLVWVAYSSVSQLQHYCYFELLGCGMGWSAHCKIYRSVPGLSPLDAGSTFTLAVTTENSPVIVKWPQLVTLVNIKTCTVLRMLEKWKYLNSDEHILQIDWKTLDKNINIGLLN